MPITVVPTWPVMAMSGTESILASAMQVTKLVAPGPLVATQTPGRPGAAGVPLRRETAALLMTRQNGANLVLKARQGLMNRHAGAAGVGEHHLDAVVDQALHENVGARLGHWFLFRHKCHGSWQLLTIRRSTPPNHCSVVMRICKLHMGKPRTLTTDNYPHAQQDQEVLFVPQS